MTQHNEYSCTAHVNGLVTKLLTGGCPEVMSQKIQCLQQHLIICNMEVSRDLCSSQVLYLRISLISLTWNVHHCTQTHIIICKHSLSLTCTLSVLQH
mgnify:CR=1 FL=1